MELRARIRALDRSVRTGVAAMEGLTRGCAGDRAGRWAWIRGLRMVWAHTDTAACGGTSPIRAWVGR